MDLAPERRAELAALLDDGAGFEGCYPRLAEYLRTTSQLGGGDAGVDAALDVRILHFMTGGESQNPYWDIVAPAVSADGRGGRRRVDGGRPEGSVQLRVAEDLLQGSYAYAIPSPETLRWVVAKAAGRPILEIGAGRGYWAHLLSGLGAEVAAYDSHPPGDHTRNTWFPPTVETHQWHPVGGLRDLALARRQARRGGSCTAEHVLFLCWPPAWGHPMASRALTAYERAGGDTLIYIGEHKGGRSGDDQFFYTLATRWQLADHDDSHVSWFDLDDVAECWVRMS